VWKRKRQVRQTGCLRPVRALTSFFQHHKTSINITGLLPGRWLPHNGAASHVYASDTADTKKQQSHPNTQPPILYTAASIDQEQHAPTHVCLPGPKSALLHATPAVSYSSCRCALAMALLSCAAACKRCSHAPATRLLSKQFVELV
jgi:hypothetical protein